MSDGKISYLDDRGALVDMLDSWAEMARQGKLVAAACAAVAPDGETQITILSLGSQRITLLGACNAMSTELAVRALGHVAAD